MRFSEIQLLLQLLECEMFEKKIVHILSPEDRGGGGKIIILLYKPRIVFKTREMSTIFFTVDRIKF